MDEPHLGPIVARREFELESGGTVTAFLGQPYPVDDGGTYFCPYQIDGIGSRVIRRAGGVDAVQALLLALQMMATDLYCSDAGRQGKLRWLGKRNLGFPVPKSIADLEPPENE
ncbi:MAG TPA: hypothetical protein VMU01_08345 [Rhizomicrobium sp.]|nr:hypothetical protein [Rhizomicrobium sp.]